MKFSKLTGYFEKLESTSSRLSLIDILSNLFRSVETPEEIEKICYLVQGRIAPFFEALEIGMAEKTVAQAIGQAYGISKEEVLRRFSKLGDMGITAKEFAEASKLKNKNSRLTVNEVAKVITEIAQTKGEGTVEKRITLLADLLEKVDPVSCKYVIRIPL